MRRSVSFFGACVNMHNGAIESPPPTGKGKGKGKRRARGSARGGGRAGGRGGGRGDARGFTCEEYALKRTAWWWQKLTAKLALANIALDKTDTSRKVNEYLRGFCVAADGERQTVNTADHRAAVVEFWNASVRLVTSNGPADEWPEVYETGVLKLERALEGW